MTRSWTKRLAVSLLTAATWLGVACSGGSSSGGQRHPYDADAGAPDASTSEDAPTSDGPDAACSYLGDPDIGPLNLTYDQEIAYLCAHDAGRVEVSVGTMECDGLIAVAQHHGADSMDFYLFNATTRHLVEALDCNDCISFAPGSTCATSATGIDLTQSPAFDGCWGGGVGGVGGGGFGFQVGCPDGGATGPSDSGPPDAPSDAPFTTAE